MGAPGKPLCEAEGTMEFFTQPTVQDLQARVGEGSPGAQASGKGQHIKQAILDEALECVWNQLGPRLGQLSSASAQSDQLVRALEQSSWHCSRGSIVAGAREPRYVQCEGGKLHAVFSSQKTFCGWPWKAAGAVSRLSSEWDAAGATGTGLTVRCGKCAKGALMRG